MTLIIYYSIIQFFVDFENIHVQRNKHSITWNFLNILTYCNVVDRVGLETSV